MRIHHLFKNKSFVPFSGPLTSEPAIGWLEVHEIPFFNFFLITKFGFSFVAPTSVMIVFGKIYLFIFEIIFWYSLIGVHKIIKSKFGIIFLKSLITSQFNLNLLIFEILDLDFS